MDVTCRIMGQDLIELGIARLADAQARGLVRADMPPANILVMFFSLVEHWFLMRGLMALALGVTGEGEAADAEHLEALIRMFLQGIEPQSR
ncbi:MAG: hypothetical protein R3F43_20795 [bacterium]